MSAQSKGTLLPEKARKPSMLTFSFKIAVSAYLLKIHGLIQTLKIVLKLGNAFVDASE